ncbi:N-acetyltransferase, partial [Streptomyces sp. SB3404]|nr:N-acetyltransferase [Streptomyces boncukensis]
VRLCPHGSETGVWECPETGEQYEETSAGLTPRSAAALPDHQAARPR